MATPQKITAETLSRMAEEMLALRLGQRDAQAAAGLLGALAGDMAALRAMNVGEAEPATTCGEEPR